MVDFFLFFFARNSVIFPKKKNTMKFLEFLINKKELTFQEIVTVFDNFENFKHFQ